MTMITNKPLMPCYLLVSIPKKINDNTIDPLKTIESCVGSSLCHSIAEWSIPKESLRMGTVDTLYTTLEDLSKYESFVESTLKKICGFFAEINKKNAHQSIKWNIENVEIDKYTTSFKWDQRRFSLRKTISELVTKIKSDVMAIEEEIRNQMNEYSTFSNLISQRKKKDAGALSGRDLKSLVNESLLVETEYMTTLFVIIPTCDFDLWNKSYEDLNSFIVPRSSKLIVQDVESGLFSVVLFKKVVQDFKNVCKDRKWVVRKYESTESISPEELDKKKAQKRIQKKRLRASCETQFSEVYINWIHLKFIHCFVESVLRYGLPINFQMFLLELKNSNSVPKAHQSLTTKFWYLSDLEKSDQDDQINSSTFGGPEKIYPYVSLDVFLDIRCTSK